MTSIVNGTSGNTDNIAPESSSSSGVKKKSKESKNCGLRKCFAALVDRKQVNLELDVLRLMLRKELDINLDLLDIELASILPYMLMYYIKHWPGWLKSAEYFSGRIQFKSWYEKFYCFITLKLNEAITTHYKEALTELKKEEASEIKKKYASKDLIDRNTQTDNSLPKAVAPFAIEITGTPVILNTIVFSDTSEGDVILKQHGVLNWEKTAFDNLTVKQLINWPHVGVHFKSPVFSFSRRNVPECKRQVSFVGSTIPQTTVDFIENIQIISTEATRNAYSLRYLKQIRGEFIDSLKIVFTTPVVLEAFQAVIDEFLVDVEDINICKNGIPTIASNTSVCFNISKCTYFRNKKLSRGIQTPQDIGYTEFIIPYMEVAFTFIASEEDINTYLTSMETFNPDTTSSNKNFELPQITFSCTFCDLEFENVRQIASHLKDEHKMEQPVLCTQCKNAFNALNLSTVRWKHKCAGTAGRK